MPWLHISLPAPPCSVLCPGYAAHIRRSTILCRRRSIQSLDSALPVYASAGLFRAQPVHVRSVLSRAAAFPRPSLPFPCYATAQLFCALPWLLNATARRCIAPADLKHFLSSSPQCISISLLFGPMLCPSFSLLCLATARRCIATTIRCIACAALIITVRPHFHAIPCQRRSFHCSGCTNLYESLLRLANAHPCLALPVPNTAMLCDTIAIPLFAMPALFCTMPPRCISSPCLCSASHLISFP